MGGITEWLCGACGGRHGWVCPYFGGPGRYNPPPCSEAEGKRRRDRDKAAKIGAFIHLRAAETPNPHDQNTRGASDE
jgi:hypothetical protein